MPRLRGSRIAAGGGSAVMLAVLAATAMAASGTISAVVTPDSPGAHSTLRVSAQGSFAQSSSSLPKSVALLVARGFKVNPRATKTKCRSTGSTACPASSKIGSGEAVVSVTTSVGFGSGDYDVPFKLFLGPARQAGDIASVVMQGSADGQSFTTTGRLFPLSSGPYGLELQTNVPQEQVPSGVTVTGYLKQLTLTAGASRKVTTRHSKRKRTHSYALITNPSSCASSGWPGEIVETLDDGSSQSVSFAVPCRQR